MVGAARALEWPVDADTAGIVVCLYTMLTSDRAHRYRAYKAVTRAYMLKADFGIRKLTAISELQLMCTCVELLPLRGY